LSNRRAERPPFAALMCRLTLSELSACAALMLLGFGAPLHIRAASQDGGWDVNGYEGRFAYMDTEKHGGVTIELL
jgi:hypothetical protein